MSDRSKYASDMTLVNSPTFTGPGPNGIGEAMSFNGTNQRADFTDTTGSVFDSTDALSVSFWAYNETKSDGTTYGVPVSKGNWNSGAWTILIHQNANFDVNFCINGGIRASYNHNYTIKTWYFYTFTWDKSLAKIYINNSEVASSSYTTAITPDDNPVKIANNVPNQYYWKGRISDVRVFNTKLS